MKMSKRTLILCGNPKRNSLGLSLAERYRDGLLAGGTSQEHIELFRIGDFFFDESLREGYSKTEPPQLLEPDILRFQEALKRAEQVLIVYPNWWGTFPAAFKGLFDRALLPGYAFNYRPNSSLWDKHLSGKVARVLVTMDSPPWYYRWVTGAPGDKQMKRAILEFVGIKVNSITHIGPVRSATLPQIEKWLTAAYELGLKDAR